MLSICHLVLLLQLTSFVLEAVRNSVDRGKSLKWKTQVSAVNAE